MAGSTSSSATRRRTRNTPSPATRRSSGKLVTVRRAVLALALCACGSETDKTDACEFGSAESAATIQDRKVIGAVAPYVSDDGLAARDEELRTSIAARRAAAWEVVGKVLAPTPLAEPMLAPTFGGQPTIPAWHTWFAREDF